MRPIRAPDEGIDRITTLTCASGHSATLVNEDLTSRSQLRRYCAMCGRVVHVSIKRAPSHD